MATMKDFDIESTAPGMTWRVGCYKPYDKRQPPYAVAIEGEMDGIFFTTKIGMGVPGMGSRRIKQPIPGGRMTAKAMDQAVQELISHMRMIGVIA
jgi:hypothetical protein